MLPILIRMDSGGSNGITKFWSLTWLEGVCKGDFVRLSGNTETNSDIDASLRGLLTMNEGLVTYVRVSLMERKDSKEFNIDARPE
ncbi:hypothetical protein VNO77_43990 [Canavalia gladiata]|uniref:Uncharacterized protein n=1 Tax=Canavalia gladiata TaxID=3824 RepID=A0AAN9JX87_CANGL